MFDSHDAAVDQEVKGLVRGLVSGEDLPEARLDWIFVGKLILSRKILLEVFELVVGFVESETSEPLSEAIVEDYLNQILLNQIVNFNFEEPASIRVTSRINISSVLNNDSDLKKLYVKNATYNYDLKLSSRAAEYIKDLGIKRGDVLDETSIQDIFITLGDTADNCLLRTIDQVFDDSLTQNIDRVA